MNIGNNIIKYRAINNLSQEQFAYLVGVSRQTVYKWENSISTPNCDKVLIICDVLNIRLNDLIN